MVRWFRPPAIAILAVAASACTVAIDQLDPFGARGHVEFERGTPVGVTSTVDGWRVTVDRAYADMNELTVFMIVEGPSEGPAPHFVELSDIVILDDYGDVYRHGGSGQRVPGTQGRGARESAHMIRLDPPVAGTHSLAARVRNLQIK